MASSNMREIVPDVPEGLELGLRNYWYPILQEEELPTGKPVGIKRLGENLVVWRDGAGHPRVLRDRCPHRGARLSVGTILEDDIQCVFHGLRFDGSGRCTLIPWEPEDSKLMNEISLAAYPAERLGGYIWAYLGDAEKFPPPPLSDEVPEELLDDDRFIRFRMPSETWNGNWLLTIDGQDAFHSVILHARSQAVRTDGGLDGTSLSMVDRRVRLVEASYGLRAIATDRDGTAISQGHFTEVKGDRFVLPCLSTNPLSPTGAGKAYVSRVWQMPIDKERTLAMRFTGFRAETAADRDSIRQFYHTVCLPRSRQVSDEDSFIAAAQGSLEDARGEEFLFAPDMETVRLRRLLKEAFLDQVDGKRMAVSRESLAFPIEH